MRSRFKRFCAFILDIEYKLTTKDDHNHAVFMSVRLQTCDYPIDYKIGVVGPSIQDSENGKENVKNAPNETNSPVAMSANTPSADTKPPVEDKSANGAVGVPATPTSVRTSGNGHLQPASDKPAHLEETLTNGMSLRSSRCGISFVYMRSVFIEPHHRFILDTSDNEWCLQLIPPHTQTAIDIWNQLVTNPQNAEEPLTNRKSFRRSTTWRLLLISNRLIWSPSLHLPFSYIGIPPRHCR